MTPQLQQAIRLLQLSTLELQQEIQTVLDSNMMLEVPDNEEPTHEDQPDANATPLDEKTSEGSQEQLPDELPVDTSWDEIYDLTPSPGLNQPADNIQLDPGAINAEKKTLHAHLSWQMELTNFSDTDRVIATSIIDSIDDNGYLTSDINSLHQHLSKYIDDLQLDEVMAVLHQVQSYDPPGIGAIDLQDCLLLQLKQLPNETAFLHETIELVREHMAALGAQDSEKLKRQMGINEDTLQQIIMLIQQLNPRPGSRIDESGAQYITPDVYVNKIKGQWRVSLNSDIATNIRVNPYYQTLIPARSPLVHQKFTKQKSNAVARIARNCGSAK